MQKKVSFFELNYRPFQLFQISDTSLLFTAVSNILRTSYLSLHYFIWIMLFQFFLTTTNVGT